MPLENPPGTDYRWGPRKPLDTPASKLSRRERVFGCLFGGAVGDALGGPVEFMNYKQIVERFGPDGIGDFVPLFGKLGALTDDTQMTLFTAEALLRVRVKGSGYRTVFPPTIIRNGLRRWLMTQKHIGPPPDCLDTAPGWLLGVKELWVERSTLVTNMQAIKSPWLGTPEDHINSSKAYGGVMRAAPAGMFLKDDPFRLGCEVAAVTHGHPTAYIAAGYFAMFIYGLMHGTTLREAAYMAYQRGETMVGEAETREMVRFAIKRADQVRYAGIRPGVLEMEEFGNGILADDALAMAVFCAMCHPEPTQEAFESAVRLAVNHSGNSDTVGAMTGQLLGTMHGMSVIPARWHEKLEARDAIEQMAEDLTTEYVNDRSWKEKYPGV
jgi:ADP-ribosylglycohydrolase